MQRRWDHQLLAREPACSSRGSGNAQGHQTRSPGVSVCRASFVALSVEVMTQLLTLATQTSLRGVAICVAVLMAGLLASPGRASADSGGEPFDTVAAQSFVEEYVSKQGLPGAAYAVVKDGRLVTTGGAGGLSATTKMSVGSVSKSFTAFAVLQLVEKGAVILDAPITDYLPTFAVRGADPEAITVRMLLDHTSGLPNPILFTPTGSLEGDVAAISDLNVSSVPGETYGYSNMNYRTLAYLVQVISGQDFDAYLSEHIFEPLRMDDTTSVVTVTRRQGLDDGHVTAYGLALPLPELTTTIGGAGGVISTAEDMGAWLGMQQRGGLTEDGTRLLSADLVEESHSVQPNAGTYALGWQHTSTADPARIGHDGSLTRYSSRQDLVPSSGYGVAVLLDSYTPTYQHPFAISTGLIDISEGRSPRVGLPVATVIDLVLAAITVGIAVLGIRGLRRAPQWARRRAHHRLRRRILRLTPQAIMPVLALVLFVGLTAGPGNPTTPRDAFGLWPAATTLLLVTAAVSIALIAARVAAFRQTSAPHQAGRPADPTAVRGQYS